MKNRTNYKNQFNQDHYERINLCVPKGMKEVIQSLASDNGQSTNAFILSLVRDFQSNQFDNMQLGQLSRDKIKMVRKGKYEGYEVCFKDGRIVNCKTKLDVRKCLAQDNRSLAQDT